MVAAATFLVYVRTFQNGFIWDDGTYICKNTHIHLLNLAFLKWAFLGFHKAEVGNWIPLTMVSYAVDYAIWGANPLGYHLANIILHSLNAFIVVVLSIRLIEAWEETGASSFGSGRTQGGKEYHTFPGGKGKLIAGGAAGLLFGLHPLHVESVAWASERKDVLCGLFFLLSILWYLKYALRLREKNEAALGKNPRFFTRQYLFSLGLFSLALMSKPMAVSLPLVLLVLDWFPFARIFSFKSFKTAFTEKLPFIALSAGSSALTLMAQKKGGAITSFGRLPFPGRALVAAKSLILYLWKMVFPLHLVPYYPYPKNPSLLSPSYFLPIVLVIAITVFCLFKAKKQGFWLACWGYFIITLLPVIGIVQAGGQSMADRYAYLPSLGPFLALGIAAAWAWRKAGSLKQGRTLKAAGLSAALLAALSMSYLTFAQIGIWQNNIVFWNYVIKKESRKTSNAYYNLGLAFKNAGQTGGAISNFSKAIALNPDFPDAYNNRAVTFDEMGQEDKAIDDLNAAISMDPAQYLAHFNLGEILARMGRPGPAMAELDKAIELNPSYAGAYNDRGLVFQIMGKFDNALNDFNKSLILDPNNPKVYVNRGKVYLETDCGSLAASDFRQACGMGDENGCLALKKMGKDWR